MFFFWFFPLRVGSASWICRFMSFVKLGSCQTLFCLCGTPTCKCSIFGYCPKIPEFLFTYSRPLSSLGSDWVNSVGLSSRNLCHLCSPTQPTQEILFFCPCTFQFYNFIWVLFRSCVSLLRFLIFTHFPMIICNFQVIPASDFSWHQWVPLFIQDVISLVLGVMGDFLLHPSCLVYYVRRSRFSRTFHLGRKSPFLDLGGWYLVCICGIWFHWKFAFQSSCVVMVWCINVVTSSFHSSLLVLLVEVQRVSPSWVPDIFQLGRAGRCLSGIGGVRWLERDFSGCPLVVAGVLCWFQLPNWVFWSGRGAPGLWRQRGFQDGVLALDRSLQPTSVSLGPEEKCQAQWGRVIPFLATYFWWGSQSTLHHGVSLSSCGMRGVDSIHKEQGSKAALCCGVGAGGRKCQVILGLPGVGLVF